MRTVILLLACGCAATSPGPPASPLGWMPRFELALRVERGGLADNFTLLGALTFPFGQAPASPYPWVRVEAKRLRMQARAARLAELARRIGRSRDDLTAKEQLLRHLRAAELHARAMVLWEAAP